MPPSNQPGTATPARLRQFLLVILLLGMLGTAAELLLVGHTEDPWQWAPLALMALCLAGLGWHAVKPSAASVRALQVVALLFVASGLLGFWLHMQAKVEFQLEVNPGLAGAQLYRKALESQSPPALAPGMMIHLGLLGLAYTWRHPALGKPARESENP